MSRIFTIRRAAYSTAFTPCGASEEWQVLPCTLTRNERLPLCPITTPISVGSPTKQAAGLTCACSSRAIIPHADAADLLVVGEREVDRPRQRRGEHVRHRRE